MLFEVDRTDAAAASDGMGEEATYDAQGDGDEDGGSLEEVGVQLLATNRTVLRGATPSAAPTTSRRALALPVTF